MSGNKRVRSFFLLILIMLFSLPLSVRAEEASCAHVWSDWETTKSATLTKEGEKARFCWDCGAEQSKPTSKLKPYVKFSKKTYKTNVGKKIKLKAKFAKGDKVKKWKSSNKNVAVVTQRGKVTAKGIGTAKITIRMKSGKKATCKVKVSAKKSSGTKKTASTNVSGSSGASSSSGGGTVYWTPSGSVYHYSRNCPTLSRSRTVYSGSISGSGKPRACKVCS